MTFIFWFFIIAILLQIGEAVTMVLEEKELVEDLTEEKVKRIALGRRSITFFIELISLILLLYIEVSLSKGIIVQLTKENCSYDEIMQSSFFEIALFQKTLGKKVWQCVGFLMFIFIAEIGGIIYRFASEFSTTYQENKFNKVRAEINNTDHLRDLDGEDTASESKWKSFLIK